MRRVLALLPGAMRGRAADLVRLQSEDLQRLRHLRHRVPAESDSDDRGSSMSAILKPKSKLIVCDGNEAAAWAVSLANVDMVAVYPCTPQSSLVEYLAKFIADGRLGAELVDVEGEHSVLSVLQGACLAGARTYTASCGPGLAFMFEPYLRTPGLRLPLVMTIVTRDTLTPQSVWGGHQDAMSVREVGWIHMYCESVQEVLDTTIMAFKIAEHRDVMLPVNVNHDGNYL